MNLRGQFLERDFNPESAFWGCFKHISFRTPIDFADLTTNYTYYEHTPFWRRWGVPSKALQEMGKGSNEPWLPEGGLQEQPSNYLTVLRRQRPGTER